MTGKTDDHSDDVLNVLRGTTLTGFGSVFVGLFTILLGAALIPYVLFLVPFGLRTAGLFVINGLVLIGVAYLHMRRRG